MKRFFIIAGEVSGDTHAARLMSALKERYPGCTFEGIGGERMREQGLESIVDLREINVVGFWEVARRYPFFKKLLKRCTALVCSGRYDAFIPVDYPGFNLRLATAARKKGVPVCFYIAPQLWAWGRNRARKLRDAVDVLMVVFPFETAFFEQFNIRTQFVGHPLLDDPEFVAGFAPLETRDNILALLPGSRPQEVQAHLPILLAAGEQVRREIPSMEIVIAAPKSIDPLLYAPAQGKAVIEHNSRTLMKRARVGIVKAGTSTLEAALCGLPFAMMYKTSFLSYTLARRLVDLPYISLVNIILQRQVVRECIQHEARPDILAAELLALVRDNEKSAALQREFLHLRSLLGDGGASARAAECIAGIVGL